MSYLIFDIETIPDLSVWTPPPVETPDQAPPADAPLPGQLQLVGAPAPAGPIGAPPAEPGAPPPADGGIVIPPMSAPKKSRSRKKAAAPGEPPKEPFPPHYAHRVIAIGWTWLELDAGAAEVKGIGCVGTSVFKDDEGSLITAWDDFVRRESPTIVTFAGRGFDVPVLSLRAFRHGVSQAWADREYRHRYSERHLDLFEQLTEYGILPRTGFSLDTFAQLMGLPGKMGVDGSQVKALWTAGEIGKIEAYCACDAVRTAFVLLRFLLIRGRISKAQYVTAARSLLETSNGMGLGAITFGVDAKRLLLEG